MIATGPARPRQAAVAAGILIALGCAAAPSASLARTPVALSGSDQVTSTVIIKSIDPATRRIDVTTEAGESLTIKVPPEVRNFDQLKVGDKITTTYSLEAAFVLSPPNSDLPANTETTVAARAAKGELPAAAVANHLVVTGAVVGIDMASHTLRLVNPQGGQVRTLAVKSAEGRAAMAKVKVGDTITAYITESLMISAAPAAS